MATKTFYVTRDMKHPLYRTRMLRAGDQLELDGPTARLYRALNAVSDAPPAKAKVETAPNPLPITQAELDAHNAARVEATKPAPKRAARKTAKRKTAGKK
jgi:hypothetical protein